jgi:hypothetical protein
MAQGLRPGDRVQVLAAYTEGARRGRAVVLLPAAEVVQVFQDPAGLTGAGQDRGVQLRMPSDRAPIVAAAIATARIFVVKAPGSATDESAAGPPTPGGATEPAPDPSPPGSLQPDVSPSDTSPRDPDGPESGGSVTSPPGPDASTPGTSTASPPGPAGPGPGGPLPGADRPTSTSAYRTGGGSLAAARPPAGSVR